MEKKRSMRGVEEKPKNEKKMKRKRRKQRS
jgi:hypothetical protein